MKNVERVACACCAPVVERDEPKRPRATRTGLRAGLVWIALSCVLAGYAGAAPLVFWPIALLAAGAGFARIVSGAGCAVGGSPVPARAPNQAMRLDRLRTGIAVLAAAAVTGVLAYFVWPGFWPLTGLGTWFGASFVVAAAIGYSGCPELGAIPSLLFRREIGTRCPPLEVTKTP